MSDSLGSWPARERPIAKLTVPAAAPFRAATWSGSLAETFCVRLLSIAQQRQAAAIASGPESPPHSKRPCQASNAPPATIATMPSMIRRSTFSRNTIQARRAVNTPSRLRKREVAEAGVCDSPMRSSSGPRKPPKPIAPRSQGRSRRVRAASPALSGSAPPQPQRFQGRGRSLGRGARRGPEVERSPAALWRAGCSRRTAGPPAGPTERLDLIAFAWQ